MKSKITNHATIIIGLLLLAVSLYLIKTSNDPQGIMRTLPYVCIGIGCGLFGHGMGNVISERAINSYPELKRQLDIEKNDERNVAIANRAKGKAFDMMTFVFGALMLSFALMGIDMVAVLLLVFAYLLVHGFALYYRFKFDKEMQLNSSRPPAAPPSRKSETVSCFSFAQNKVANHHPTPSNQPQEGGSRYALPPP